jgi:hypothetical protein
MLVPRRGGVAGSAGKYDSEVGLALTRDEMVRDPQPHKRRRSSWVRFEAQLPNECLQSDLTRSVEGDASDTRPRSVMA